MAWPMAWQMLEPASAAAGLLARPPGLRIRTQKKKKKEKRFCRCYSGMHVVSCHVVSCRLARSPAAAYRAPIHNADRWNALGIE